MTMMRSTFAALLLVIAAASCANPVSDYCVHIIDCKWTSSTMEVCRADTEKYYGSPEGNVDCTDVHAKLDAQLACMTGAACDSKVGDATPPECQATLEAWMSAVAATPACGQK